MHGILTHDGESFQREIKPKIVKPKKVAKKIKKYIKKIRKATADIEMNQSDDKRQQEFNKKCYLEDACKSSKTVKNTPSSKEATIVRLADTLCYVPDDFRDMIDLGMLKRSDLPPDVTRVLGDTRSQMLHFLINDLIYHSYETEIVGYSERVAEALLYLKKKILGPRYGRVNDLVMAPVQDRRFNLPEHTDIALEERMIKLFHHLARQVEDPDKYRNTKISRFISARQPQIYFARMDLPDDVKKYQAVIDYIASLSDQEFFEESEEAMRAVNGLK